MNEKDIAEKVFEAPAIAVEKSIEGAEKIGTALAKQTTIKRAENYWKQLGPGLTTGAADDDPSGIATYSQTGAKYGFGLLWLSAFTFPLMAVVQEMCARIGLVTGRGLAGNIRQYFPKWVLYFCAILLFVANSINIGADLGAMAETTRLLVPGIPFAVVLAGFTVLTLGLQIFSSYEKYARYLKYLTFVLLSYVLTAFVVNMDWPLVLKKVVVPTISFGSEQIILICAILGTTISPYLFFWQTSQEVEEEILEGKTNLAERRVTTGQDIKKMRVDVWSGMFVSNVVMFFIIAVAAATLNANGLVNIETASDAASALKPLAGNFAYLLFALGIIGTGMLAVPVLAGSASYAVSESMGWKVGLYRKLKGAYAFYGVIIVSTIVGLTINFVGIDPIRALIYSAVVNALVAPVVLVLIVLLSSNKKVMGDFANHKLITLVGWGVVGIMALSGIAAIFSFF